MTSLDKEWAVKNLELYEIAAINTGYYTLSYREIKALCEVIRELTDKNTIVEKMRERLTEKANENLSEYNLQVVTVRNIERIAKEIMET